MVKAYILVHTSACAFMSEEVLNEAKIYNKLVSTPREFSSDCGMSVYVECPNINEVYKILDENKIEHIIKIITN